MTVITKTAETNKVSDYYVSKLAGPRVAGRRVTKGEKVALTEHQARAELASGALVRDEALVDDPWGDAARAKAAQEAADKAAADAKAAADKAAAGKGRPADPTPPAAG